MTEKVASKINKSKSIVPLRIKMAKYIKEEKIEDFIKDAKSLKISYEKDIEECGYSKELYKHYKRKLNVFISKNIVGEKPTAEGAWKREIVPVLLGLATAAITLILAKRAPLRKFRKFVTYAPIALMSVKDALSSQFKLWSIKSILKKGGIAIEKKNSANASSKLK